MQNQVLGKDGRRFALWSCLLLSTLYFLFSAASAQAASFSLVPSATEFQVGDTFEVSVLLNTGGVEINAVEIGLEFSPDKLQVISPNTGRSIIEIWAGQPKFNNKTGTIELRGGIPNGLSIEGGLVTTIQFRVKSSGSAFLQFRPETKILANDGLGTDVLVRTPGVIFNSKLPPPAGPIVSSPTHPDQNRWYPNDEAVLNWAGEAGAEGYSFILNDEPLFVPDTISEGLGNTVSYTQPGSGTYFFHIQALVGGIWGSPTHFQVNVDKTQPAEFEIEVVPGSRTSIRQPVLEFLTTDAQSGMDHYEMKVIALSAPADSVPADSELFSDVMSPHVLFPLEMGSYDVIIRAYDKAYNYREVKERISIVTPALSIVQDNGIQIVGGLVLTWPWIWIIALAILLFFGFAAWRLKRWPKKLGLHEKRGDVPALVQRQLDELQTYRKKYGKLAAIALIIFTLGMGGTLKAQTASVLSSGAQVLTPPVITTISNELTTEETFYIGGETVLPETEVVVYWSNQTSGETFSALTTADEKRQWFYHHDSELVIGNYVLWAQSRVGGAASPPSAQLTMVVRSGALQLGPTRISYELIYLLIISFLVVLLLTIGSLIIRHWSVIRREHRKFLEEIRKGEEAIRRGFAVLRRDMELEFALIRKAKLERKLSSQEQAREQLIMKDLEEIEQKVGKEIWELEAIESGK